MKNEIIAEEVDDRWLKRRFFRKAAFMRTEKMTWTRHALEAALAMMMMMMMRGSKLKMAENVR